MAASAVDVLIFEDHPEEAVKIAEWFGLAPYQYTVSRRFDPAFQDPQDGVGGGLPGWGWVQLELGRFNPKLVVFDHFLSGVAGDIPYQGGELAKKTKGTWNSLGVVLVTTGAPEQGGTVFNSRELASQKDLHDVLDYVWYKPWGPEGKAKAVQAQVQDLLKRSRRPLEHASKQ